MVKKNCIIVQVRQTSKRLKNKIFMKIGNTSLISLLHSRLKKIENFNIVYAIPSNKKNYQLYRVLKKLGVNVFKGSEDDVLDRFYKAAKKFKGQNIVRITGDCPFVDPHLIKKILQLFLTKKVDYASNIMPPSFPDGFDVEVFNISTLEKIKKIVKDSHDKEHVTSLLRRDKRLKKYNFSLKKDYSKIKLSVDTLDDLKNIRKVFKLLKYNKNFSYKDVINNKKILNFFYKKNNMKNTLKTKNKKSQDNWKKAKKLIAGGNMLLSKNPDRHLKSFWPVYYKSAKGCMIKDYDNNTYTDLYLMGVGTNILGYSNREIDNAVKKSISSGNMSSLNCLEEVQLAETLIKIHPQFDMAKFAKTGGEANAVAIRIARAAAGRDKVAICGYHGWHDWYLAAGLNKGGNKNFKGHLANDLGINGVPKSLKKTTYTFEYGNYQQFDQIINNNNIGVVKI